MKDDSVPRHPAPRPNRTPLRPNFIRFVVTGAVLGALIGLVVGSVGPVDAQLHSRNTVVIYLVLTVATVGGLVSGAVALVLDFLADRRRASTAGRADREPTPESARRP